MTSTRKIVAVVGAVVFANFLSVYINGFPFLYCWLGQPARSLYLQWGLIGIYIAVGYFCYQMWKGGMVQAFFALMAVVAVLELPRLADTVFRHGGSCGA